jgi:bifunctional enzyme CysN/CysC
MSHKSELIQSDIDSYLAQHEQKELLRFITCGSVDDGKSTLIGRLLYDAKMIYEDQLAAIEKDSIKHGTTGGKYDPALLTDGLREEREQGITIDVAYQYFSTTRRKFIIADTPGHEQYTRNMATGASTADLSIILVDARKGVLTQTKRHSFITSLLGIKHVLVAINKMDLVDYSEEVYHRIRMEYQQFSARLDIPDLHFIPISALDGDNVVDPSVNMPWYSGSTLMHFLESVYIGSDRNFQDFRMPVQYVNRPNLDFRGFCGTISSGIVRQGDEIMALPSKKTSKVKSIVTFDGDVEEAFAPQSVTLTLEDEIDISRGDMIVRPGNVPRQATRLDAMLIWMSDQPMVPGKQYLIKQTTKTVNGSIQNLRYRVDVNTLHRQDAAALKLNEIGRCELSLTEPLFYDGYRKNRSTGALILIDRITNATVAAGMILDRSAGEKTPTLWEEDAAIDTLASTSSSVTSEERIARFGQNPATILLTGLTGAGKTTIAGALERRLFNEGRASIVLDGQDLRRGISKDLGFTAEDRSENLRRGAEIAKMVNDSGLICIAAFLAPSAEIRQKAAAAVGSDRFIIIHLDAPIEICRQRDDAGHYALADEGEITNFPGVTSPYETPESPDLRLDTANSSIDECVEAIFELLTNRHVFV